MTKLYDVYATVETNCFMQIEATSAREAERKLEKIFNDNDVMLPGELSYKSYDRFRTHIKSTGGPFKGTDVFELPCDRNIYVFSDNDYFDFCIQTGGIFEVLNTDENGMSLKTISMSKVFPAFVKNPFMRADKETILEIIEAFAKAAVEAEE